MSLPYFPFYPSDYLGDTMHLSTEEHGAYLLLLITMWQHGARLPNDPAKLARIARVPSRRWAAVWGNVSEFFREQDGDIYSPRMREEYEKATAKSAVRRTSGKAGAAAKALKSQEAPSANASGLLKHTQNSYIRDTTDVVSKPRKRGDTPTRASRLSADWTLPDELRAWAIAQGWPPPLIDHEAERMRDWSLSSPNGAKRDWSAAWRNWMRDKPKPGGPGNGQSARPAPRQAAETERVDRALERARRRDVERGSGGNESARFGGMAHGSDTDASPPLLRLAHG